jgi:zinc protease
MRRSRVLFMSIAAAALLLAGGSHEAAARGGRATQRDAKRQPDTAGRANATHVPPAPGKPMSLPGAPVPAVPAKRPAAPPKGAFSPSPLSLPVQKASLDNGLRVVMSIDHTSPTVSVSVTYDVGSRNEEKGRSGFAHLFEHMMFEGSANVPKGEHFRLVSSHGGTLNGTTSADRTNYFEVLPSNELALALWLEADRMKSLDQSAENFDNQRKVVEEEYRMRVSNVAFAPAQIRLQELVYQGYWPYEHDSIGAMQDLDQAQIDWVQAFHDAYYAPNLAVLAIAGDFEPDEAMELVHRFFDTSKKRDNPIPYAPPPLPETSGPKALAVEDDHAKTAGLFYGWPIPATRETDHYALELAAALLGDGESSRLHQRLVRDKALAQDVSVWTADHRGPDMLAIHVKLADGARLADAKKAIDTELARLGKDGPTEADMVKLQNRTDAAFVLGLQSNLQRAIKLGQYELFWGDARLLNAEPARYFGVTRDDIKRVVAQFLVPDRQSTVEVRPTGMAEPAAKPAPSPKADAAAAPVPKKKLGKGSLGKEREGGLKKHRRKKEVKP